MSDTLYEKAYNPDVLTCIANLSNDEVFTPPSVANAMLDLLPQEIFSNPDAKFLDPACKSGVFLREIAKRLLEGLKDKIPDLQERIDHIFKTQLYGIAITELTSLLSRRSVYCSKYPNCKYSVTQFNNPQGNIFFNNTKTKHLWINGKCLHCGASEQEYGDKAREGLERHAYQFIHNAIPGELENMKFDVIIGNPPYQLSDGGAQASAIPIYHLFVQQAKKLNPRYIIMITPSRWMTGGRGLDSYRKEMLEDNRLAVIHDFKDATKCFSGVEIKGGVSYFLWDKEKISSECLVINDEGNEVINQCNRPLLEKDCDIFIRNNSLISIFRKVQSVSESSFSNIVSSMKPFGLRGDFFKNPAKYNLPPISDSEIENGYTIYGLDEKQRRVCKYVKKDYPFPKTTEIDRYKMFVPRNQGEGELGETLSTPIFAKPNECCTETFIVIGGFNTEEEMHNCWTYIKTKFFRTMLAMKKNDQGCGQGVYQYIPLQDFSKSWTDEELYAKYKLSPEEIDFIESMIRPME